VRKIIRPACRFLTPPFAETRELLAGFWIWKCASTEEAIEWVKKVPMPMACGEAEIEIRQLFDMEDFGEEMTPVLREQEERQRAQLAQQS
jgi:YCII-related domain